MSSYCPSQDWDRYNDACEKQADLEMEAERTPPECDCLQDGQYIGDEENGIYVDWTYSPNNEFVRVASVVDCSHFTDSFGDDEVVPLKAAHLAVEGRLYAAANWCVINGVDYEGLDVALRVAEILRHTQTQNEGQDGRTEG